MAGLCTCYTFCHYFFLAGKDELAEKAFTKSSYTFTLTTFQIQTSALATAYTPTSAQAPSLIPTVNSINKLF